MIYDKDIPLAFLHVPRTGGIVIRDTIRTWVHDRFVEDHVYQPPKITGSGVIVAAHYDRSKGAGIESVRPTVKQFVTILRDPFDQMVSMYFYWKNTWNGVMAYNIKVNPDIKAYGANLREFALQYPFAVSDYLPLMGTPEEFGNFILIGTTPHMQEWLNALAVILNQPLVQSHGGNSSRYDEEVPDNLRDAFRAQHPYEYILFDEIVRVESERLDVLPKEK